MIAGTGPAGVTAAIYAAKAARKLARRHHPDVPSGDKAPFRVISEACALRTGDSVCGTPLADDEVILRVAGRLASHR